MCVVGAEAAKEPPFLLTAGEAGAEKGEAITRPIFQPCRQSFFPHAMPRVFPLPFSLEATCDLF